MQSDRVTSLFLLVLSIFFCIGSLRLGMGHLHDPGPGYIPFFSGVLLGLLAIGIFLKGTWGKSKSQGFRFGKQLKKGGWILGTLIVYALLLEKLGFLMTTFLFLIICLSSFRPRRWVGIFLVSLLTVVISYLLFAVWLKVQLPTGILGI
ncbi:MAG: hypothetical protein A2162_06465 [Deltaproteobacteria bacterium RBG_13_52_11b]|nr:MAG: hypothetical protein A2162_06465 [Deltaproteobacteria bacterium RBG_13_52_11b]